MLVLPGVPPLLVPEPRLGFDGGVALRGVLDSGAALASAFALASYGGTTVSDSGGVLAAGSVLVAEGVPSSFIVPEPGEDRGEVDLGGGLAGDTSSELDVRLESSLENMDYRFYPFSPNRVR